MDSEKIKQVRKSFIERKPIWEREKEKEEPKEEVTQNSEEEKKKRRGLLDKLIG